MYFKYIPKTLYSEYPFDRTAGEAVVGFIGLTSRFQAKWYLQTCTNSKQNGIFEHAQNAQIQIHPTHVLSLIETFALH